MGWWTVASQLCTLANFYLTTWEEYHTGVSGARTNARSHTRSLHCCISQVLYLSAFSGPVEGILMVCVLYAITGVYGPSFWDQGVLTVLKLDHLPLVRTLHIKNLPLNECFLVFGFFGLLGNIAGSYSNVSKAMRKKGVSATKPLTGLLPFAVHSALLIWWLNGSDYIRTRHLIPFAIFWGECPLP